MMKAFLIAGSVLVSMAAQAGVAPCTAELTTKGNTSVVELPLTVYAIEGADIVSYIHDGQVGNFKAFVSLVDGNYYLAATINGVTSSASATDSAAEVTASTAKERLTISCPSPY